MYVRFSRSGRDGNCVLLPRFLHRSDLTLIAFFHHIYWSIWLGNIKLVTVDTLGFGHECIYRIYASTDVLVTLTWDQRAGGTDHENGFYLGCHGKSHLSQRVAEPPESVYPHWWGAVQSPLTCWCLWESQRFRLTDYNLEMLRISWIQQQQLPLGAKWRRLMRNSYSAILNFMMNHYWPSVNYKDCLILCLPQDKWSPICSIWFVETFRRPRKHQLASMVATGSHCHLYLDFHHNVFGFNKQFLSQLDLVWWIIQMSCKRSCAANLNKFDSFL